MKIVLYRICVCRQPRIDIQYTNQATMKFIKTLLAVALSASAVSAFSLQNGVSHAVTKASTVHNGAFGKKGPAMVQHQRVVSNTSVPDAEVTRHAKI